MNNKIVLIILTIMAMLVLTAQTCSVGYTQASCYDDDDCSDGYVCESGVCASEDDSDDDDGDDADAVDTDGDGVADSYDLCSSGDDTVDDDEDGIPDCFCYDEDGGTDYYTGTSITFGGDTYTDQCTTTGSEGSYYHEIVEYICTGDGITSETGECEYGCNDDGTACSDTETGEAEVGLSAILVVDGVSYVVVVDSVSQGYCHIQVDGVMYDIAEGSTETINTLEITVHTVSTTDQYCEVSADIDETYSDADADGVADDDDLCADHDDGDDQDSDGTPDGCDDTDGDGLYDDEELNDYSTDPNDADSDDDGLDDLDDIQAGGDPNDADSDDDGLEDGDEATYNTSLTDDDSDDDGLSDGDEVNTYGTDPMDDDSDNDGVLDGDDQCEGYDDSSDDDSDGVVDYCQTCSGDTDCPSGWSCDTTESICGP